MKFRWLIAAAALSLAVGSADGAFAQAKGEPIRLPHLTTFSGAAASWGETMLKAAQIAAQMVNEKGGVHGRPIEFYPEDAPYDNMPNAMTTVKKVARDPNTLIVFDCGGATTVVAAAHDVMGEAKLPCFGFSSAGHWRKPAFNEWTFRLLPQVATAMPVLLPKVVKKHNIKSVGMAFTNNDEAPVANAKVYRDLAKQFNLKIVDVSGQLKEAEYRAQVTKLKGENVDLLITSMQPEDAAQFMRQAREGGLNQPLVGGIELTDKNFKELNKGKIGTAYTYGIYDPTDPAPYLQDYLARFKKETGKEPGPFEAIAADAAFIVAHVMNQAKTLDRESIRQAWSAASGVPTFTGKVSWKGSGEALREGVLIQMYDKEEKLVRVPESYWGAGS
jgi:branched-chain amino acid transport system substrate-binding protein